MGGESAGIWAWADAWILASLDADPKGVPLWRLVGSADAHNHAIPTRDELATALGNLIAAGLVETTEHGFRTTKQGNVLKKHWKSGMFSWSEALLPQLQKLPYPGVEYTLTDKDVDQAYAEYRRRA